MYTVKDKFLRIQTMVQSTFSKRSEEVDKSIPEGVNNDVQSSVAEYTGILPRRKITKPANRRYTLGKKAFRVHAPSLNSQPKCMEFDLIGKEKTSQLIDLSMAEKVKPNDSFISETVIHLDDAMKLGKQAMPIDMQNVCKEEPAKFKENFPSINQCLISDKQINSGMKRYSGILAAEKQSAAPSTVDGKSIENTTIKTSFGVDKQVSNLKKPSITAEKLPDISLMGGPLVGRLVTNDANLPAVLSEKSIKLTPVANINSPESMKAELLDHNLREFEQQLKELTGSSQTQSPCGVSRNSKEDMAKLRKEVDTVVGRFSPCPDTPQSCISTQTREESTVDTDKLSKRNDSHMTANRRRLSKQGKTSKSRSKHTDLAPVVVGYATSWKPPQPPLPKSEVSFNSEVVVEIHDLETKDNFPERAKLTELAPLHQNSIRRLDCTKFKKAKKQKEGITVEEVVKPAHHRESELPSIAPRCTSPTLLPFSDNFITPKDLYKPKNHKEQPLPSIAPRCSSPKILASSGITPRDMYKPKATFTPSEMYHTRGKRFDDFKMQPKGSLSPIRPRVIKSSRMDALVMHRFEYVSSDDDETT
ncbi:hypothetical protein AC249_AIPGENE17410 [Exaiptasia diaphana]|nr:hypothetical protein AC249_AIPGENE17410 [Exaiptasia diaphana]